MPGNDGMIYVLEAGVFPVFHAQIFFQLTAFLHEFDVCVGLVTVLGCVCGARYGRRG